MGLLKHPLKNDWAKGTRITKVSATHHLNREEKHGSCVQEVIGTPGVPAPSPRMEMRGPANFTVVSPQTSPRKISSAVRTSIPLAHAAAPGHVGVGSPIQTSRGNLSPRPPIPNDQSMVLSPAVRRQGSM